MSRRMRIAARIGEQVAVRHVTATELAAACRVSVRTAQGWIARDELPGYAARLVEYEILGRLPEDARRRLASLPYVRQERDLLRRRVRELDRENGRLRAYIERWRAQAGAPIAVNDETG